MRARVLAPCLLVLLSACDGDQAPAGTTGSSAADNGDEPRPPDKAFVKPGPFEVIRTRSLTVQLAPDLGEQTVTVTYDSGGRFQPAHDVVVASAQVTGQATIALPDSVNDGDVLAIHLSPQKLVSIPWVVYWSKPESFVRFLDYAYFPNHRAGFNCDGIAHYEDGHAEAVLTSATSKTELGRFSIDEFRQSWVDPNGYAYFSLPIEAVPSVPAGEMLTLSIATHSRTERVGCYAAVADGTDGFVYAQDRPLSDCP
jgi:hypothetical protein